ncbi:MAG: DUF1289 domain-containing protein [Cycloclasticus sp.]|jgi:predicted Fe-S protein YdhL (DUF1289 family)|nr:DUF1289 domain-containing protein [Cycloclasticus sp.]
MESPCVRLCTLNEDDMCLGCGRLLNEITSWTAYSEERRVEIIKDCVRRIQMVKMPSPNLPLEKNKPVDED